MVVSLCAVSFSMPVFGYMICQLIERSAPTVADLIGILYNILYLLFLLFQHSLLLWCNFPGLILIVESGLSIRLYMTAGCEWRGVKHIGPTALISALVILHLQPDLASTDWYDKHSLIDNEKYLSDTCQNSTGNIKQRLISCI